MILLVFVVVSVFGYTSACSCLHTSPHNIFCRSSAVFRGKVLNETKIFFPPTVPEIDLVDVPEEIKIHILQRVRERVYDIDVHEVFRDTTGELRRGNSIKVSTPGDVGMCGVSLSIGREYYLRASGSNINDLGIGICSRNFDFITTQELDGFKGGYDCDCIVDDGWETVQKNETHKFCQAMIPGGYSHDCLQNYAHCQKSPESGRCMWNADETRPECQRALPPLPIDRR